MAIIWISGQPTGPVVQHVMFYISSLFREKKKVVDGKVGTRILHLAVWFDPHKEKEEKKG